MDKFKYIASIAEEDIENKTVIPCINEQGQHCILIKNFVQKTISTVFATDNLVFQLDSVLELNGERYYFHIITATKTDSYSVAQFEVIYEYIFKKINNPIEGYMLNALITSLEDYFRTTPDPNLKQFQIGVYGELLTIKILYDSGYRDIIDKYHENFYSKHDIEINSNLRMEIKTTASEKRIHTFKHNQISRDDVEVYVCSCLLEQSKEGTSLLDLFNDVQRLYVNPDSKLAFEKLKKRCGLSCDNHGLKFAYQKALNDFKIFKAESLPKIGTEIPDGVTNIKYDVDCSLAVEENMDDVVKRLNNGDSI